MSTVRETDVMRAEEPDTADGRTRAAIKLTEKPLPIGTGASPVERGRQTSRACRPRAVPGSATPTSGSLLRAQDWVHGGAARRRR
jgi:hypothetical protein